MNILANYNHPGKHNFLVQGEIGELEVEIIIPNEPNYNLCAIIGHPHSLYGGTMNNKVVTTVASVFANINVPTIKFNFRGVGKSFGTYDAGIGESADMLILVDLWKEIYPECKFIFTGFSFGSFVAYRTACNYSAKYNINAPLLTIAPSVNNYDYKEYKNLPSPWLVIQGDKDEIVEAESVYNFVNSFKPSLDLLIFNDTTHFFHGKLIELKAKLTEYLLGSNGFL